MFSFFNFFTLKYTIVATIDITANTINKARLSPVIGNFFASFTVIGSTLVSIVSPSFSVTFVVKNFTSCVCVPSSAILFKNIIYVSPLFESSVCIIWLS